MDRMLEARKDLDRQRGVGRDRQGTELELGRPVERPDAERRLAEPRSSRARAGASRPAGSRGKRP